MASEDRTREAAEKDWRKLLNEHAAGLVETALGGVEFLRVVADQGGLTVEIQGPDGEWRRYYVRLTEVPA